MLINIFTNIIFILSYFNYIYLALYILTPKTETMQLLQFAPAMGP